MANELTASAAIKFLKGQRQAEFILNGLKFDVSGTDYVRKTQNIGTSAEAIDIGDITTPGFSIWINRDATNFVEIRDGASGADVVKLGPGQIAMFPLATATPYAIADTAACDLEYLIVEA